MLLSVLPYKAKTKILASSGIDPFFENVVSLCHFDVAGNPVDQISGNSWTLSGATVSSASPKFGSMSLAIPNSRAYASNTNSQMVVGTADFTLEFFFYTQNTAGNYYCLYNDSPNSNIFEIFGDTPSGISLWFSGAHHYPGFSVTPNTWHHIAVVRQNGILYTFVDGVLGASTFAYTGEITNNGAFAIGSQQAGIAYPTNGNIDEFRFTKGIARYTASGFTPTTVAFTDGRDDSVDPFMGAVPYLAHYNNTLTQVDAGTCTASVTGPVTISSTTSKFGSSSLNFPNSGNNYVTLGPYTNFNFNGDFTVECWINPGTHSSGQDYQAIFSHSSGGIAGTIQEISIYWIASTNKIYLNVGHSNIASTGTHLIAAGTWGHVALTKQGSTYRVFVNGALDIAGTYATNVSTSAFSTDIGRTWYYWPSAGTPYFAPFCGYIDDFRITNVCRYTRSFAAPTAAFPDTFETTYDPYANQVVYNLPLDSNVNSTVKGYSGSQSGGQFSSGKFGNCFEKAAITDIAILPSGPQNSLGKDEFTIDFWVNYSQPNANNAYVIGTKINAPNRSWYVYIDASNNLRFVYSTDGSNDFVKATVGVNTITLNVWHHVAIVRHRTLGFGIFVDGVLNNGWTSSSATLFPVEVAVLGGCADYLNPGSYGLKIDDFRLTTGVCRYTANFIPPGAANKTV